MKWAGWLPYRNLNLSLITLLRYSKRSAGGLNVCPLNSKKLVALRLLPIGIANTMLTSLPLCLLLEYSLIIVELIG